MAAARLRRGLVVDANLNRSDQIGMHAAQLQAQLADLATVAVEQRTHAADRGVGVAQRLVNHQFHWRWSAGLPGLSKFR